MAEEMIRGKDVFKGCLFTFLALFVVLLIATAIALAYVFY
jgi:hypothetical protein